MILDKNILVTGGLGFIGSAFIRHIFSFKRFKGEIVNLDLGTYAADFNNLKEVSSNPSYVFYKGDINDFDFVNHLCNKYKINMIVNFAAETHVDNSITSPNRFIKTNINGVFSLLEIIKKNPHIYLHHISTDEVFGSSKEGFINKFAAYNPSSPYSAAKASADHLIKSYHKTYGFKLSISYSSNNYGPCQNDEKFIPVIINSCLDKNKYIPIYGNGKNVRNWIYVEDHVKALWSFLNFNNEPFNTYSICGNNEVSNIDLINLIINIISKKNMINADSLISKLRYVKDRLGHDFRYALKTDLNNDIFQMTKLNKGLEKTIDWYLETKNKIINYKKGVYAFE